MCFCYTGLPTSAASLRPVADIFGDILYTSLHPRSIASEQNAFCTEDKAPGTLPPYVASPRHVARVLHSRSVFTHILLRSVKWEVVLFGRTSASAYQRGHCISSSMPDVTCTLPPHINRCPVELNPIDREAKCMVLRESPLPLHYLHTSHIQSSHQSLMQTLDALWHCFHTSPHQAPPFASSSCNCRVRSCSAS